MWIPVREQSSTDTLLYYTQLLSDITCILFCIHTVGGLEEKKITGV